MSGQLGIYRGMDGYQNEYRSLFFVMGHMFWYFGIYILLLQSPWQRSMLVQSSLLHSQPTTHYVHNLFQNRCLLTSHNCFVLFLFFFDKFKIRHSQKFEKGCSPPLSSVFELACARMHRCMQNWFCACNILHVHAKFTVFQPTFKARSQLYM